MRPDKPSHVPALPLRITCAPPGAGTGIPPTKSTTSDAEEERLARLFAGEPELILACLQALDRGPVADLETILSAAERALKFCPKYADLHYFAARAAMAAGRLDHARDLLVRALQLNPQYNDALILAARVATAQGRQNDALAYLRQALVNGADYADVHLMLGDLWRQRDELTQARQAYQRALNLNVDLAAARQALATLGPVGRCGGTDELPA
jgi:tetratricopeptide (TPR) repeat protein